MNWVAPIKDEETLKSFEETLKKTDVKYYIMFEIGMGTGLQLQDILKLKVRDVKDRDSLEVFIGTRRVRRVFRFSQELSREIAAYVKDRDPDSWLIVGHASSGSPLSREQAYRALRQAGSEVGLEAIGAQTMRKTFAWRYYHTTGDIYYLQNLLNHASASITYRYIGEDPSGKPCGLPIWPEDTARSRRILLETDEGAVRIGRISDLLGRISKEISKGELEDEECGRLERLLLDIEGAIRNYDEGRY